MQIKQLLKQNPCDNITVFGWVKTIRISKTMAFIALNDGSCLQNLQIIISCDLIDFEHIKQIKTGYSISANGSLVQSPTEHQFIELHAKSIHIIGTCADNYPLQKKYHVYEFLRELPHLRARTNTFSAVFRIRSALTYIIHQFFQ